MSERLPIRLVRFSTRKEHSSTATMPPNRLLTLSMTIKGRPCVRTDPFGPRLPVLRARTLRQGQILEAGLPRASQKETGPCGPVPKQAVESLAAQLSFWMYWPLSHSYIT